MQQLSGHRFPQPMYAPIMVVIAAQIGTRSTFPASVLILMVIVILAAGYFGGREYVDRHINRRNWK